MAISNPLADPKKTRKPGIAVPPPVASTATAPSVAASKPLDPLQRQYQQTRAGFDAATSEVNALKSQQSTLYGAGAKVRMSMPRPDSFRAPEKLYSGANGTGDALRTVEQRLGEAQGRRQAFVPQFKTLTNQFRQQTAHHQTNAALATAGAAPLAAPQTAPAPTAPAPQTRPATPGVRFAGSDAEPSNLFKRPAAQASPPTVAAPSTFRTGDGRTGVLPPGITARMGANGVPEFSGTGKTVADATAAIGNRAPGDVPTQSGIAMPTFAPLSRPGVASTFGLSVNDPRLNDQIARPPVELGPNQLRGGGAFRGPDAMGEFYRAQEDRAARQKLASDLDSQRFRQELVQAHGGRQGRAATAALGEIAREQANLALGGERLSHDAVQGRAGRDAAAELAQMEANSQERRADAAGTRALQIARMEDATKREAIASEIARPRYEQDRMGNIVQIAGTIARPVQYEDGSNVQGQAAKADGEITAAMQFRALNDQLDTLLANPPQFVTERPAYDARLEALRQQIGHLTSGAPPGMTLVGSKGGKPVYRDQTGRLHTAD